MRGFATVGLSAVDSFFANIAFIFALCLGLLAGCSSPGGGGQYSATAINALAASPQVHQLLATSCFDCHANQQAGWSARLAPSYLFGVDKARRVLNFSDWAVYPSHRRRTELQAIGKVVADGSMPPGDYDFFHPAAKLTPEDKQLLVQWAANESAAIH